MRQRGGVDSGDSRHHGGVHSGVVSHGVDSVVSHRGSVDSCVVSHGSSVDSCVVCHHGSWVDSVVSHWVDGGSVDGCVVSHHWSGVDSVVGDIWVSHWVRDGVDSVVRHRGGVHGGGEGLAVLV